MTTTAYGTFHLLMLLISLLCLYQIGAFLPPTSTTKLSSQSGMSGHRVVGKIDGMTRVLHFTSSRSSCGFRLKASEENEGGETEDSTPEEDAPAANPVDDVFNSVPFLTKRKEAMEKEMASIDENLEVLAEQYSQLEEEWGDKVAVMRKDYDGLKARYYNDTQELATMGRSAVFVEVMSVVDDFERAKMAYKPTTEEEKEILGSYDGVKDAIIHGMMANGMEEIKTVGEAFDFKLHDCMFTEQSTEYAEDIVTREFSKGFMIGGKVIRPAKVACSLGPGP